MMSSKGTTIQVRISEKQKKDLTTASKMKHVSLSHFVLESAYTAAQEIIAQQSHFTLSSEQWDVFCRALDEAPREIPKLKDLLNDPSCLDQ